MDVILSSMLAYILGSIPFCYVLGKICGGVDLRKEGSGNVGATNLYRVCGIKMAFWGFLSDFLKGFSAVYLACDVFSVKGMFLLIPAFSVILGHVFPVFLKFKGGKAVSTVSGILLYLSPGAFVLVFAVFWLVYFSRKIVSLASVVSALTLIILSLSGYFFSFYPLNVSLFQFVVSVLILIFHRENIKKLLSGREEKTL